MNNSATSEGLTCPENLTATTPRVCPSSVFQSLRRKDSISSLRAGKVGHQLLDLSSV